LCLPSTDALSDEDADDEEDAADDEEDAADEEVDEDEDDDDDDDEDEDEDGFFSFFGFVFDLLASMASLRCCNSSMFSLNNGTHSLLGSSASVRPAAACAERGRAQSRQVVEGTCFSALRASTHPQTLFTTNGYLPLPGWKVTGQTKSFVTATEVDDEVVVIFVADEEEEEEDAVDDVEAASLLGNVSRTGKVSLVRDRKCENRGSGFFANRYSITARLLYRLPM
jgi:hypothetical protein